MNSLKDIVKAPGTHIVDVRSTWEFEDEHIPGSVNMPLENFPAYMDKIKAMKGPVILYCRSGNRSGMAMMILKQNGMTEVYNGGGLEEMKYLLN